ncbi:hypothetical protein JCM3765_006624 [Sporobolomyces pararoseus]
MPLSPPGREDSSTTSNSTEEDNSDSTSNSSDSIYSDDDSSLQTSSDSSKTKKKIFAAIAVSIVLVGLGVLFHTAEDTTRQERLSTSSPSFSSTQTTVSSSSPASSTSSTPTPSTDSKTLGVSRALPTKLRGVNLGSSLIAEFWMLNATVEKLGCSGMRSEWECNEKNGLAKMQPLWEQHWNTFYSAADFEEMKKLGLNAVRIPFGSLTSTYYPRAQKAIRDAEQGLGPNAPTERGLTFANLTVMSKSWGSGDPTTHIDMNDRVFFDDHNYAQWIVTDEHTTDNYLKYACSNTRPIDVDNTITGEWSLSTIGISEGLDQAFYRDFFSRQVANFERGPGWFFWSWKTEIDSPQWGYQQAVAAEYIPEDLSTLDTSVCNDSWK